MRALITGICGQDGSYLAEFLLNKGYTVFGLTRPVDSHENIRHIEDRLYLLKGDLTSYKDILAALQESNPHEVYNLGAITHVGVSFSEPLEVADVTGLGVARILEAIRNYNPKIRFYQASTSELFGKVLESPQRESTPLNPVSPYAVAKLYGYWMTILYRRAYGIFACNGIMFNHESERRGLNFVTRKITYGVNQIKKGLQKEIVLGNLDSKRDWGYAPDYVEAMWKILQHDIPDDYVIGTGITHSIKDLAETAFEAAGMPIEWRGIGLNEEGFCGGEVVIRIDKQFVRPAEVMTLCADASKARAVLGWNPKTTFKEMITKMVKYDS